MDRRTFLKSLGVAAGVVAGGGTLSACSGSDRGIPSGDPGINVVNASFETLTGEQRRLNLVLLDMANEPLVGGDVEVYIRELDGAVRSGPHPATYFDESGEGTGSGDGIYQATLPLATPGAVDVVAVTDGTYGVASVNVVDPASAVAPIPGAEAVSTPTPTQDAPLGYETVCTQEPPCGMHAVSLDAALAEGRPVAVLFATPAFCQTVACGPSVANLEAVRTSRDWGDVAFVHCEVFSDAGQTVGEPVTTWNLPTEPWLFAVGADGRIADRLDGPMVQPDFERLLEGINEA